MVPSYGMAARGNWGNAQTASYSETLIHLGLARYTTSPLLYLIVRANDELR